jgi:hypothetical protein
MSHKIVAAALLLLASPNLALGNGGVDALGSMTGFEAPTADPASPPAAKAAAPSDPFQGLQFQDSPFESCKDVTMISNSDFKKNETFWKEAIGECGINVQVLPDSGFFQSVLSSLKDQDVGTSSYEFLKKVGERAGGYQQLNNDLADHLRHCAMNDKAWFDTKLGNAKTKEEKDFYDFGTCEKTVAKVKKAAKEAGEKARIKRAVLEATGSRWEGMKGFLKNATGSKLAIESMPIPEAEMAAAKKIQAEDDKKVNDDFQAAIKENMKKFEAAKAKKERAMQAIRAGKASKEDALAAASEPTRDPGIPSWFQGWYRETRGGENPNANTAKPYVAQAVMPMQSKIWAAHKDDFLAKLGEVPVLAYLGSVDPTNEELAKAAAEVLKNGEAELKDIRAKLTKAAAPVWANGRASRKPSLEERGQSLLEMMKYGPIVNELLKEDSMSCRTATGVANMILSSDARKNTALIAGMVGTIGAAALVGPAALAGTALASPALLATGVGAAWGASIAYGDHQDYIRAKQRTFSVVETQENGRAIAGVKDFEEAREQFLLAAALSPIDLVGSGLGLKAGAALGYNMGKMLEKPGAKIALSQALKKRGLSEVEIESHFSKLVSADAAVAGPAARKILTEVGIDPSHVNFVRMAASKGLFKPENPEAFAAVMKEVTNRKGSGATNAVKIAHDVIKDVNAAKINSGNRDQVLRAAIAGAEFGHREPAKLAAVINDWEQGLDGLARTYEIARTKMDVPEIRGLATLEARQNAAFSKALDDMMEGNPEFRMLTAEDRAAAKSQMMACGIKGN